MKPFWSMCHEGGSIDRGIWEDVLYFLMVHKTGTFLPLSVAGHGSLQVIPGTWQLFCDHEVSLPKKINQCAGESRAQSQSSPG